MGKRVLRIAVGAAALLVSSVWAQQNVGIGTNTPHPTALLELYSTSKGLLIPRMTQAERNAISSPATGLLIYQTDNTPGFYYWNGTAWIPLLSSSSGGGLFWSLTGNSITGTEFLGTTNNQPLVIRTNNTERMRVTASGDVGIGTTTPLEAVEVVREGVSPAYVSTSYANANFAGAFVGRRARGTISAPAAVQSGDALVFVGARGYDGTAFTSASRAFIRMDASENWTATAQGTRIVFATTANGTTSTAERVVIQSSGDVEVKGGNVLLQNSDNTARQLRLYEPSGAGTNFTAFQAQAQASDIIYTLPASDGSPGQALTTDGSGQLSWSWNPGTIFVRKTANESVTNSTTPQADDHLYATLPANSIWEVEILLRTRSAGGDGNNGGIQVQLNAPTGTSMQVFVEIRKGGSGSDLNHHWHYGWITAPNTSVGYNPIPGTTPTGAVKLKGLVIVGSTGGTLQLYWAQNAANGNATTVYANSYMKLTRIQ